MDAVIDKQARSAKTCINEMVKACFVKKVKGIIDPKVAKALTLAYVAKRV